MNLGAGLGIAVREFATGFGPVDYAQFVDRTLCGILEAKPEGTTLSGFSEKTERYIRSLPGHLVRREGQVRFEYLASSTEILFRDHSDPAPRARRVFFFQRPETLRRWLNEASTMRTRLQTMPTFDPAGLRECQIDAITGLEKSLAADAPRASFRPPPAPAKPLPPGPSAIAYSNTPSFAASCSSPIAPTSCGRRGTSLSHTVHRGPHSFTELYNVQRLGPAGLDQSAAVVVATIQRVYSVLTGHELSEEEEEASGFEAVTSEIERIVRYNPAVPIESFDMIVTDECHSSIYGTSRQVLEYFDAFIVGLTAIPSLHTMGFSTATLSRSTLTSGQSPTGSGENSGRPRHARLPRTLGPGPPPSIHFRRGGEHLTEMLKRRGTVALASKVAVETAIEHRLDADRKEDAHHLPLKRAA
jgi:type I restriction enzyme R subunit